jgi:ribonuclease BN (tRNA processing enzyme)
MYDVGFGDCFALYNDDNILQVDFGSMHPISKFQQNEVINLINKYNVRDGVLTHFHNDHCSGYEELSRNNKFLKFDRIYIPNFFNCSFAFIKLNWYILLLANPRDSRYKYAQNFISSFDFLYDCLKNFGVIVPKKKDDYINNIEQFKVYWPNYTTNDIKDLELYVTNIEKLYFHHLEEFRSYLKEKNFIEVKILMKLIDKINKVKSEIDNSDETKAVIKVIEEKKRDLKFDILSKEDKQKISDFQNKVSLVFASDNVLMTGDIDPYTFDNYIVSDLSKHYKIIKAPHHGTKKYFSNKLPTCKELLIPNGYYKANHFISEYYPLKYDNVHCSEGFRSCELLENGKCCNINNCIYYPYYDIPY